MICHQFEEQLDFELGKHPLITSSELTDHAAQCKQCNEVWNRYLLLEESLLQWNRDLPEIDVVESVISFWNNDLANTTSTQVSSDDPQVILSQPVTLSQPVLPIKEEKAAWHLSSILAVVTVALMLSAGLLISQSTNRMQPASVVNVDHTKQHQTNDNETSSEIRSVVKDAGVAYYSLAQNAADAFSDASLLFPQSESIQLPTLLQEEKMTQPIGDVIKKIENDVKPIQSDFRKAIDFLFTSVPEKAI